MPQSLKSKFNRLSPEQQGRALLREVRKTHCDEKKALLLIALGADLRVKGRGNETALHWAAHHGRAGIVEAMVKAGARTHAKDSTGRNAAAYAYANHHSDLGLFLIKAEERAGNRAFSKLSPAEQKKHAGPDTPYW